MPIACTLPADRIPDQLGEWATLRATATAIDAIDGGIRMTLPADRAASASDLAAREQRCCSFLTIDVRAEGDRCVVEISSAHPGAGAVIAVLAGSEG